MLIRTLVAVLILLMVSALISIKLCNWIERTSEKNVRRLSKWCLLLSIMFFIVWFIRVVVLG